MLRALVPGDTIALVSPASAVAEEVLAGFIHLAEARGYRVKVFGAGDSLFGRMAAEDSRRAEHLLAAFADEEVSAIVCARGGYGSGRLLCQLEGRSLSPKILVGYSDITNLLLHIQKQAQFTTFHGPMAVDLVQGRDEDTIGWFFSMLEGKRLAYALHAPEFTAIKQGSAQGVLYGGNISIIGSLAGTNSLHVPQGAILVLEDVNEFMYALDRSLVHLQRAGIFDNASGILFADMRLKDGTSKDNSLGMLLEEVIENHFDAFDGPIAIGLPCGHTQKQLTLPLGSEAKVTVSAASLSLSFEDFWERPTKAAIAA